MYEGRHMKPINFTFYSIFGVTMKLHKQNLINDIMYENIG